VKRIEDVRVLRSAQFAEDAGRWRTRSPRRVRGNRQLLHGHRLRERRRSHPDAADVHGREGFRRGLDLYFARHDGQAVTCDDFVSAIADANGQQFEQFRLWYSQAGTPRVRARGHYDAAARRYTLELEQRTPPTPGQQLKLPLHIPFAVGLVGRGDGRDRPLRISELADAGARLVHARAGETGRAATAVLELTQRAARVRLRTTSTSSRCPRSRATSRRRSSSSTITTTTRSRCSPRTTAIRSTAGKRCSASSSPASLAVLAGAMRSRAAPRWCGRSARCCATRRSIRAFREQLFTLPSEGFRRRATRSGRPVALRAARNAVRECPGERARRRLAERMSACNDGAPYSPDPAAAGRRALKNASLAYWVETRAREAIGAAVAQFDTADNMTDGIGALHALMRTAGAPRDDALARFAARHADEPLVLDKWFALQATMPAPAGDAPVLDRVRELMRHPAFSMRNPNRLRALVGSFCNGQPRRVPCRRRLGLRLLGRTGARGRRIESAGRRAPGARARSLAQVRTRPAGADARGARRVAHATAAVERRARDRRQGARLRPHSIARRSRHAARPPSAPTQYLVEKQREKGLIPTELRCCSR